MLNKENAHTVDPERFGQLYDKLEAIGYRLWYMDGERPRYNVSHVGNHNHAEGLTLEQAEEWSATAEPAADDCPLFDWDGPRGWLARDAT